VICRGIAAVADAKCDRCQELYSGNPPDHVLSPKALGLMQIPPKFMAADRALVSGALRRWTPTDGTGLFLRGGVGSGKTYTACAILKDEAMRTRKLGMFANVTKLLDAIRDSYSAGPDPLPTLADTTLLVLDDVGVERVSEWAQERFYLLVNERYNAMRSTIYTSNIGLEDVARLYGERVASRIAETCIIVKLDAPDRRTHQHVTGEGAS
jgi:DNA replication protein DnaC